MRYFLIAFIMMLLSTARAEFVEYSCPESITTSWDITSTHDGFGRNSDDLEDRTHNFSYWNIAYTEPYKDGSGPPAYLKLPVSSEKVNPRIIAADNDSIVIHDEIFTYEVDSSDIWAVCHYRQSKAKLFIQIHSGGHVKQCRYEKPAQDPINNIFSCS